MAGLFEVENLEARKRALVAESEVYRATLNLEVQNLQLYGVRISRKVSQVTSLAPLALIAAPVAGLLFARRKSAKRGLFATALTGWRLYQQFAPVLGIFLERFAGRKNQATPARESTQPEA